MKTEKTMQRPRKKGERAHSILMALAQDAETGKRLHESLRKEAEAPDAQEARSELALLHEMMKTTRNDGLRMLASMRASADITLH